MQEQLEKIVKDCNLPQDDWRYCFIKYPEMFDYMSKSYLRIRFVPKSKVLLVSKISTSGYNRELQVTVLEKGLNEVGIGVSKI